MRPDGPVCVLTSFNADNGSSESQWDGEALPDVDHTVEQAVLCIRIWDDTLLLLQRLNEKRRKEKKSHTHIQCSIGVKLGVSVIIFGLHWLEQYILSMQYYCI